MGEGMKEWKCSRCGYEFCPCCGSEDLEKIEEVKNWGEEDHHIHPKFMGNPKGFGEQYPMEIKKHKILHSMIMNWLWQEIPEDKKNVVIRNIIKKSKRFIGVKDD